MTEIKYYENCLGVHVKHPLFNQTLCNITLEEPLHQVPAWRDVDDLQFVLSQPVTCDDCKAVIRLCETVEQ